MTYQPRRRRKHTSSKRNRHSRGRARISRQLNLESMEDRRLLTTFGIDYGPTASDAAGNDWNDFAAAGTNNAVHDLDGNMLSGVSIQVTGGGYNTAGEDNWVGLSTNGGSAPIEFVDSVTTDIAFSLNTTTISGLDPSLKYNLYGVSHGGGSGHDAKQDALTVTGDVAYGMSVVNRGDARTNGTFHTFLGVSPNGSGTITIAHSESTANNPVINGILIESVDPGTLDAVDDDYTSTNPIDEDTVLNIVAPGVFINDTPSTPIIESYDATSANGAAVTIAADGSFTYDPTSSATLQALNNGDMVTDTFTYTIREGDGSDTLTSVGVDTTAGANWRTNAQLDVDGDDAYGTDGYFVYGIDQGDTVYRAPYPFDNDQVVAPAYITSITTPTPTNMWSGNGNFGQMEDPANGNALTNTPLLSNPGNDPGVYTIERVDGAAFRLTIMVASGDGLNVTFNTTVSDGVDTETQNATHTANGLHYHVYDVAAGNSDITVTIAANNNFQATGFAFDTAPTVASVGVDTTAGANWRTNAQLDIDGDDAYGTDGYFVYGIDQGDTVYRAPYPFDNDQVVAPAYITSITTPTPTNMWSGNGNFGQMEDPANGNALTNTPLLSNPGNDPGVYTIDRTDGAAFRLTIMVASGDGLNVTFNTTVSDGVYTQTQNATHTANGLHYHVYDVAAGSSDIIVTIAANNNFQATGFAFDTLPTDTATVSVKVNGLNEPVAITDGTKFGIDYGPTATDAAGNDWNDFAAAGTDSSVINLDSTILSGVTVAVAGGGYNTAGENNWVGLSTNGGGAPAEFVDSVTTDIGFNVSTTTISGLDTSLVYNIYGVSHGGGAGHDAKQDALTVTGDISYGTSIVNRGDARTNGTFHSFLAVKPDGSGVITIAHSESTANNPVVNGILIEAVTPPPSIAYWDGTDTTGDADGGTGTWNTTNNNWDDAETSGNNVVWDADGSGNDAAVFGGPNSNSVVTLGEDISLGSLTVQDVHNYVIGSGPTEDNTLDFSAATNPTITVDRFNATITAGITGSPDVTHNAGARTLTLAPAATVSMDLGAIAINKLASNSNSVLDLEGDGDGSANSISWVDGSAQQLFVNKAGAGTWTLGDVTFYNRSGAGAGGEGRVIINAGDLIATGTIRASHGVYLQGGVFHYNNAAAVNSTDARAGGIIDMRGGSLDNTSGAAINSSTHNPPQIWRDGGFTFVGSNGANSDLNLGAGAVTLATSSPTVTIQDAATTLTVGGVIAHGTTSIGLIKAGQAPWLLPAPPTIPVIQRFRRAFCRSGTAQRPQI